MKPTSQNKFKMIDLFNPMPLKTKKRKLEESDLKERKKSKTKHLPEVVPSAALEEKRRLKQERKERRRREEEQREQERRVQKQKEMKQKAREQRKQQLLEQERRFRQNQEQFKNYMKERRDNEQQRRKEEKRADKKTMKRAMKQSRESEKPSFQDDAPIWDHDPEIEWEVEYLGPIFLEWGQKQITTSTGQKKTEFYIKSDDHHRIWIKWKVDDTCWSAEGQENLVGIDSDQIRKVLRRKKIWPMPSSDDGLPNWKERLHKVMLAGYTEWKHPCENKNNVKFHQGSQVVQSTNEVIIDEESDYETEEED